MTAHADDGAPGPDHLLPQVRTMLDLPAGERIRYVRRDKWVEYAAASAALKAMADVLVQPNKVRPRGVFVVARPDNGKSALLKRFVTLNHATTLESGEASVPVALVWSPDEPTEAKLWVQVLRALKVPHRSSDPARHLKEQALRALEFLQVRMLVFDELHNILRGSAKRTEHLLTLLKMLVNELPLRIVVAGTLEALQALRIDAQLATRFDGFPLPPWHFGMPLLSLLKGLEAALPLPDPSGLATSEMVELMLPKANQTIGGYVEQIKRAAELAIVAGKGRIDAGLIRAAQRNAGTDLGSMSDDI